MKVQVLYFDREVPRIETFEFEIVKMARNSLICKPHGGFLSSLVDKDMNYFFIHRNVFNSLNNNSICQIIEKDFGARGRCLWLTTFKTM